MLQLKLFETMPDALIISPSLVRVIINRAATSQYAGNKCKEDQSRSVDAMLAAQMFEILMQSRKTLAFWGYGSLF